MGTKHFLLFLVLVITVGMVACTRPASTAPTESASGGGLIIPEGAFGAETPDVMATLLASGFMTQTAIAEMGEGIGGGEGAEAPTEAAGAPAAPGMVEFTPTTQAAAATPFPTATSTLAPVQTVTVPETYVLHKGEFPYCISRRFDVDPNELLALNGLSRGENTYPGQTLKIPQSGKKFPGERALQPHPTTYTVKAGDTLYTIACWFGDVAPEAIAQGNGLSMDAELTTGQTLQIP
ncbi:MAG: LysM domain-containing protein [Chloroflexota bacterium]